LEGGFRGTLRETQREGVSLGEGKDLFPILRLGKEFLIKGPFFQGALLPKGFRLERRVPP